MAESRGVELKVEMSVLLELRELRAIPSRCGILP